MEQPKYVWLDGELVRERVSRLSILTHSLHYGSAVFEGIRCYDTPRGPAVFRLRDHLKRLVYSASIVGLDIPHSLAALERAVLETVRKNRLRNAYIRPLVFYGTHMGLDPTGAPQHVAIAAWEWGKYLPVEAARATLVPIRRIPPSSGVGDAKIAGQYFNSVIAVRDAKIRGFDEALMLDDSGHVAEGSAENIFFVRGRTLYTPERGSLLPGITRDTIMELASNAGLRVCESRILPKQLARFSEAFFVGTAAEVTPIDSIDTHLFSTGADAPVTSMIKERYDAVVRGEVRGWGKWITYIK